MRKFSLVLLALVLALGTLGVGYSMWSQTVTIQGNVTTGTLLVGIRNQSDGNAIGYSTDPAPNYQVANGGDGNVLHGSLDPRVNPTPFANVPPFSNAPSTLTYVTPDKNIASLYADLFGNFLFNPGVTGNNHNYYDKVGYVFTNVYPFYAPSTFFALDNGGNIPVKIQSLTVTVTGGDPALLNSIVWYWTVDSHAPNHGTLAQLGAELQGYQLDPGQELYVNPLTAVFLENTPQNDSVSFTISIDAVQWNEYTP